MHVSILLQMLEAGEINADLHILRFVDLNARNGPILASESCCANAVGKVCKPLGTRCCLRTSRLTF